MCQKVNRPRMVGANIVCSPPQRLAVGRNSYCGAPLASRLLLRRRLRRHRSVSAENGPRPCLPLPTFIHLFVRLAAAESSLHEARSLLQREESVMHELLRSQRSLAADLPLSKVRDLFEAACKTDTTVKKTAKGA